MIDRVIAQVCSPGEILALLRQRVDELKAPHLVLDAHIGIAAGHIGKILGPAEVRRMGPAVMFDVLQGVGLGIAIVEVRTLEETIADMGSKYRKQKRTVSGKGKLRKRLTPAIIHAAAQYLGGLGGCKPKRFRISHQKTAGKARWTGVTAAMRTRFGKSGARARWRKVKATTPTYVGRPADA